MAIATIASNLQGCKCFANLETKLWTKIPTGSLVQMKGNLSQIYRIPFHSQKNCIDETLVANLFFKFEQNLHNSKFDAIAAIATFSPGCKVGANLFFRPVYTFICGQARRIAACMQSKCLEQSCVEVIPCY